MTCMELLSVTKCGRTRKIRGEEERRGEEKKRKERKGRGGKEKKEIARRFQMTKY